MKLFELFAFDLLKSPASIYRKDTFIIPKHLLNTNNITMDTTWIKASEQLPPPSEFVDTSINVIVTDGNEVGVGVYYFEDEYWYYDMIGKVPNSSKNITHWTTLPSLPKTD